jgi:hypothetical protein
MLSNLEEFRCPQFQIVHDGERHLLFRPGDTIGEHIDPVFAMSLAITRLDIALRDPIFERRMLPATKKYRPTVAVQPELYDGDA